MQCVMGGAAVNSVGDSSYKKGTRFECLLITHYIMEKRKSVPFKVLGSYLKL